MKHPISKSRLLTIALAATVLLAVSAWASATPMHFYANLTPLNNSGISGHASLTRNGNQLSVHLHATGLEANAHPQHIHGPFVNGDVKPGSTPTQATLPTVAADDTDGDGLVETAEGLAAYGPILVPLTTNGVAGGNFPTVGTDGVLDYTQTFDLADSSIYQTATKIGNSKAYGKDDLLPLPFREFVIHGLTAPKKIDSVFAGLPGNTPVTYNKGDYDPFLPVAAGVIKTAVPEPSEWGTVLVGLGLISGLLWLRRRDTLPRRDA
jgi:hypothetical protein